MSQLLSAVAHMHARGLVHCDVKLDNVLRFIGPTYKLCDLGCSLPTWRPRYGGLLDYRRRGTSAYLAPDVLSAPDGGWGTVGN
eukprot:scaffold254271_cov24-Tisochrysis_lutea.AAC.1